MTLATESPTEYRDDFRVKSSRPRFTSTPRCSSTGYVNLSDRDLRRYDSHLGLVNIHEDLLLVDELARYILSSRRCVRGL